MSFFSLPLVAVVLQISTLHGPDPSDRDDRLLASILYITGADSEEELDEYELERFQHLATHPLSINRATRSRLLSSGLFSSYQAATIADHRQRTGDILSISELATIHGFGRETASALAPFIVLESSGPPAAVRGYGNKSHDVAQELTMKAAIRSSGMGSEPTTVKISEAGKYHLDVDGQWEFNIGANGSSEHLREWKNGGLGHSFSMAYMSPWKGKRFTLSRLVLGDYNLRFGQGLAMWSGMTMSGFGNIASMSRNPTGLNPYRSYSSAVLDFSGTGDVPMVTYKPGSTVHRGVGAEFSCGHISLTTAFSMQKKAKSGTFLQSYGLLPVVNLSYFGLSHQESLTSYIALGFDGTVSDARVAADFRAAVRGVDIFGELAMDPLALSDPSRSFAFLLGTRFKAGAALTLGGLLRYYPSGYSAGWAGSARSSTACSDEHGAAVAARLKSGDYVGYNPQHLLDLSFDAACYPSKKHLQIKVLANYTYTIDESWSLAFRLQYRHRNYAQKERVELRSDGGWDNGIWVVKARLHGVYGNALGGLAYIESGYTGLSRPDLSLYVRAGVCHTGGWADRIYVYERDAPGNFNVPAMYGDQWWLSFYGYLKIARVVKLALRVSTTNLEKCDGRLQLSLSF